MPQTMTFKLGRLPRTHNPNIPHLSALLGGTTPPPPPPSVDYTQNMPQAPNGYGMMLNDTLGDCTCAAFYHARQIWTFHSSGTTQTAPDSDVELLYEKACGYKPSQGGEGPGGNEQHVLTYLHKSGAPIGPSGPPVDKVLGFVEVDPRIIDDVKRTIYNAGVAYIGFNVPANIMPDNAPPPAVWTVDPSNNKNIGGHAVVLPGYDADGAIVISWGQLYKMTWQFFSTYVDEVYNISDAAWSTSAFFQKNGLRLPAGLTPEELQNQMQYV
ncbi:MAG TPA: hypothetical protein VMB20_02745 [Candidatus Acidoferrum sp.]|nr:hypothetical protein [Candidatus Acidoferrum sp.]